MMEKPPKHDSAEHRILKSDRVERPDAPLLAFDAADPDSTLDRAVATLRDGPIPPGPPDTLLIKTFAAIQAHEQELGAAGESSQPQSPPLAPIRLLFPRFLRVAAILAAVMGAIAILLLNANSSSLAFADVIKKVRASRTLTFTVQTTLPQIKQRISMKFYMQADGRLRVETADPTSPFHSLTVFDPGTNKGFVLVPGAKQAVVLNNFGDFTRHHKGDGNVAKMFQSLKSLGDKPEKELGDREFDGRVLRGFVAKQDGIAFTVWADPKTGDPVRIEFEPFAAAGIDSMKMAMTDIRLDPPIDPALFSVEIPAGYNRMELDLPKIEGGEASVVAALHGYTRRAGGSFPPRLTDWGDYFKVLKADAFGAAAGAVKPQPGAAAKISTEVMEYMANIGAAGQFVSGLSKDGYGYLGKGKSTGDKGQIIFWYKAPDGGYRAIYGDLSVRDIKADEIPK